MAAAFGGHRFTAATSSISRLHGPPAWHLYPEEPKMRVIPVVFAAFVVSSPAFAEGWEEYAYPDYFFAVAFPANPRVETTTYHVADNHSVPARLYSVRQANVVFKMTV